MCVWPKYWSFSFNISPSNEYSGLIYFRIGWFDLFAPRDSLAPQFESISTSVLSLLLWPDSLFSCKRKLCAHYQSLHNSSQPHLHSLGKHQSIFYLHGHYPGSVQFSHSVCPTFCNPMNRSTPGLSVHHQLLEFTQTHVH